MIDNVCVIIPAYNPEKKIFLDFLDELVKDFTKIIVINDGSKKECNEAFIEVAKRNIKVVTHSVNLGKGRALKTGFNEALNIYPECIGAVCADCDGQHTVQDIKKCVNKLIENKNSLIIGSRDFKQANVPFKSRFGNILTRNIFKLFVGLSITDTQTGLRAMSRENMKKFMNVSGERYEFETNMLIECKNENIRVEEVIINTIYIENNKGSKFNPVKDSIAIYKLFGKYIFSSISSFIIDILLFSLFLKAFNNITNVPYTAFIATVIARIISSLYNFIINGKVIFKNITKSSLIKYIMLVIIQMVISGCSVEYLKTILNVNETIIKIPVDSIIFIVNFVIQREFVFKDKTNINKTNIKRKEK